ncbi:MAG: hypothetical protein QXN21_05925 [Candidatus Bathyarchaeia archaeon]
MNRLKHTVAIAYIRSGGKPNTASYPRSFIGKYVAEKVRLEGAAKELGEMWENL